MNRCHFAAGAAIVLAGILYDAAGTSRLFGSPDPLIGTKTVLYLLSGAGAIGFVAWLNRRDGGSVE